MHLGSFRILEATQSKDPTRSAPSLRQPSPPHQPPALNLTFALPPEKHDHSNAFSLIIGKNGTGKSRTLAAIANYFASLGRQDSIGKRPQHQITVKYAVGERIITNAPYEIDIKSRSGQKLQDILPSVIIASSTTAFDKFKIPFERRSVLSISKGEYTSDNPKNGITPYRYVGLRDAQGRATIGRLLNASMESISNRVAESRVEQDRIAAVFRFLGYRPVISIFYRESASSRSRHEDLVNAILNQSPIEMIEKIVQGNSSYHNLLEYLSLGHREYESIRRALSEIRGSATYVAGYIETKIDFDKLGLQNNTLEAMMLLRKIRMVSFLQVQMRRLESGDVVDLLSASSGELSIMLSFLGIASHIRNNALILIDEPETSLHPEWQTQYLGLLKETFSHYTGCHFIVATHSPLVLSGASTENTAVIDTEKGTELQEGSEISGKSTDQILVDTFDSPGNDNLFLRKTVMEAISSIAKEGFTQGSISGQLMVLRDARPKLANDSPLAITIDEIEYYLAHSEL